MIKINRRQFAKILGLGAALSPLTAVGLDFSTLTADSPQIAITMDDFNLSGASPEIAKTRNLAILDALRAHSNLKAAAFVCGKHIDNELGVRIVGEWDRAGHLIANHTYSHKSYNSSDFEDFAQDILRVEGLIKNYPRFTKLFRFPALKEGNTVEKRDKIRSFLKSNDYQMGYVTVDASDWYIDERLRARLAENPQADVIPYKNFYLEHLWNRATYYNDLAKKALGRDVRHTLLIHHNVLNALFLNDVLDMFERRGWRLIDARDAFQDKVFSAEPNIVPAGESIIWALAKESGKFDADLRYPGEDSDYEKPKMDALGL